MEVVGRLHDLLSKERHIELCARGELSPESNAEIKEKFGVSIDTKGDGVTVHFAPQQSTTVDGVLRYLLDHDLHIEHVIERGIDLEELFTRGTFTTNHAESVPQQTQHAE